MRARGRHIEPLDPRGQVATHPPKAERDQRRHTADTADASGTAVRHIQPREMDVWRRRPPRSARTGDGRRAFPNRKARRSALTLRAP